MEGVVRKPFPMTLREAPPVFPPCAFRVDALHQLVLAVARATAMRALCLRLLQRIRGAVHARAYVFVFHCVR